MTVAVVTDSTADLPKGLAQDHGLHVVPLNVHFGDETFQDEVTIHAEEFYRRLGTGGVFPKTSAPSPGAFLDLYRTLLQSNDSVLSVHISSKVSATYGAALQAKSELGKDAPRVEVVDSLQASMALGWVAVGAARAARQGKSLKDVAATATDLSRRARFFGLVETLEYLLKGGRIGRAQAFLGSLLKVKPILSMVDGVAHGVERARTRQKGIERIKQILERESPLSELAVLYTTTLDEAQRLAEDAKPFAPASGVTLARLGPVVGTYLGPGMLGLGLIKAGD